MTSSVHQQDAADTTPDPDAPMTVQLTVVRAEPLDEADDDYFDEDTPESDHPSGPVRSGQQRSGSPKTLPGVIAHHLDALRSREADDEVLELVTYELRRITGVRNVRSLQGRHSA